MANTYVNFLSLAPEMRNRIYHFAVVSEDHVDPLYVDKVQPAITRTCGQIRKKSLPLYYAHNTFVLRPPDQFYTMYRSARYQLWTDAVGYENLRQIGMLVIMPPYGFEAVLTQNISQKYLRGELIEAVCAGGPIAACSEAWIHQFYTRQLHRMLHEINHRKVEPGLSPRSIDRIIRFLDTEILWYGWTDGNLQDREKDWLIRSSKSYVNGTRRSEVMQSLQDDAERRCHSWPDDAEGNDRETVQAWLQGALPLRECYVPQESTW